jgi:hypothetical protein
MFDKVKGGFFRLTIILPLHSIKFFVQVTFNDNGQNQNHMKQLNMIGCMDWCAKREVSRTFQINTNDIYVLETY